MAFQQGFDASQTIVNFDDFASEGVKARFQTGKTRIHVGFEGSEPCLEACEPPIDRIDLDRRPDSIHYYRENRYANREIKLNVVHACSMIAWLGAAKSNQVGEGSAKLAEPGVSHQKHDC